MAYPTAFPGYQPQQQGFGYQPQASYPPMMQNQPMPQQNGQGWGYMPPDPSPPQETEMDILKQILLKLDEIQKGMVKHGTDAE